MVTEVKERIHKGMVEQQGAAPLAAANIIRKKSKTGALTLYDEILAKLTEEGLLKPEPADQAAQMEAILKKAIEQGGDVKEISDRDGVLYYYSTRHMDESYARILVKKREDPLLLLAEVIRENSAVYPRPVPIDIFKESPFSLTEGEILAFLKKMEQREDYQDIAQTTTSIETVFLYSTRHLEPDYAATLAEWLDVGQINNP